MEMNAASPVGPEKQEMRASVTVAGHPLHAILTDFPIAAFTLSVVWNVIAIIVNDQPWYAMTFWTMFAGLIMVIPTALIGFMDYMKVQRTRHPGAQTAMIHMIVNVSATALFFFSLLFRGGPGYLTFWPRWITFAIAVWGFSLLALGAFLGGRLVYHHGIGIDPDADAERHVPLGGGGEAPVTGH